MSCETRNEEVKIVEVSDRYYKEIYAVDLSDDDRRRQNSNCDLSRTTVIACYGCTKNRSRSQMMRRRSISSGHEYSFAKQFNLVQKSVNLFSLLKYSNLIALVLIVVLSNCVNIADTKPIKERTSTAAVPSPRIRLLGQQSPKQPQSLSKAGDTRRVLRQSKKMDRLKTLGQEMEDRLKVALSDGNHHIEAYVKNAWQDNVDEFDKTWKWRNEPWLGERREIDIDSLGYEEYLQELIELYARFKRIAVGIDLIREEHKQEHGSMGLGERREMVERVVECIYRQIQKVLANLQEFYEEIDSRNGGRGDQTDAANLLLPRLPDIQGDIIPEENRNYEYQDRNLQHWVILREYLQHLQFAKNLIEKFRKTLPN